MPEPPGHQSFMVTAPLLYPKALGRLAPEEAALPRPVPAPCLARAWLRAPAQSLGGGATRTVCAKLLLREGCWQSEGPREVAWPFCWEPQAEPDGRPGLSLGSCRQRASGSRWSVLLPARRAEIMAT